jgi:NAD(P)H-flavin reductase
MKPRIAEVRRMAELLSAEHEDVEDLAREVISLSWDLANERDKWCMVATHPGAGLFVHGPYGSRSEVERAVKRGGIISAGIGPASGMIVRMIDDAS